MTNREIAQEISSKIGNSPVPFNSVYSIALQIYNEIGGQETQFDSVYSILLEILPLVEGGINPIKEVNELPEASKNKDKFFRLDNGDKDVYAAKLLSSVNTEEWGWKKVVTEDVVNDLSNDLTVKANKVDIAIPVNMQTQAVDWTVLNSVQTGIYRVQFVANFMGQTLIMQQGWATISNSMGSIAQTIIFTPLEPSASGSPISVHNRVSRNNGNWFDYEFKLGVINDNKSSSESTYSSSKIDNLISTLETRIAALEGK